MYTYIGIFRIRWVCALNINLQFRCDYSQRTMQPIIYKTVTIFVYARQAIKFCINEILSGETFNSYFIRMIWKLNTHDKI